MYVGGGTEILKALESFKAGVFFFLLFFFFFLWKRKTDVSIFINYCDWVGVGLGRWGGVSE